MRNQKKKNPLSYLHRTVAIFILENKPCIHGAIVKICGNFSAENLFWFMTKVVYPRHIEPRFWSGHITGNNFLILRIRLTVHKVNTTCSRNLSSTLLVSTTAAMKISMTMTQSLASQAAKFNDNWMQRLVVRYEKILNISYV